ncbi:DUF2130 domain-containing protein [Mesomycoplasma dispar]|uniref:DUF2130 domain-containing protein n=1 Tax=Mesomycoplasma dispar TaxID=86660 RepID=A0ABM6PS01_9BACT|nr:DUF2130 domain-containing protein [Mesomycoplasma dispar]ATP59960.1 hypothetical protein CSW10_03500 [Mesomycoplasma dispar]
MEKQEKKQIRVSIIDKKTLKYELLEDGNKGDWFTITSDVQNYINAQVKEKLESLKIKVRNDILANDESIKEKDEKIKELLKENSDLKSENLKTSSNLQARHSSEINEKDKKIGILEAEIKSHKANESDKIEKIKLEQQVESDKKIKEIEEKLNAQFEEKSKKEQDKRILDVQSGYDKMIKEKESKIRELEDELNKYKEKNVNSKEIGENLENWILERYKNVFPFDQENDESISFTLKKDTENLKEDGELKGTKADFIFTIRDKENEINESIILEAKSESKEKPGKQKNKDFFKKLESDRVKKKARYAILVTELEPDQYITIEVAPKFPKIFICRPHFYLALLMILKSMIIKEEKLTRQVENLEEKEKIIKDFEEWKNNKITKIAEKIRKKSEEGIASSNKIIDEATKIQNGLIEISNTLIRKLKSEIDNFKITKLAKKVEKIEKSEKLALEII